MIPSVKLMLVLATVLGVLLIGIDSIDPYEDWWTPGEEKVPICVGSCEPLDPIQEIIRFFRPKRSNRGEHVFNNGLLGFHRSVLQKLLKLSDVGGYDEQLNNLVQDLMIPLSRTQENAISTWVVRFSSGYVNDNADEYEDLVSQLREALVEYLKADTSVNEGGRNGIQELGQSVQNITSEMVNREVYVDKKARNRWLQKNPGRVQEYNQVRRALRDMFQNILQDFKKVSDKIRVFREEKQLDLGQ